MDNCGAIVDNSGAIVDNSCAIIDNSGAIVDDSGAIVDNSGAIVGNSGAIVAQHKTRGYINTFIVYTQKNLLCVHKRSLVHAQHSCACSGPGTPGARDPRNAQSRARDRPSAFFGSLAPGVTCKEHAQECCACTRDLLCIHKRFLCVYTINESM